MRRHYDERVLIAEDLLLLATDDRTGKTRSGSGSLDYALAGALLCELEILGRIRLTASRESRHRKNRVVVDSPTPCGDPLLDASLRTLTSRDRTPTGAIRAQKKRLRSKLFERLVAAGVLRVEHVRLLGLIPVSRHPSAGPARETELRAAVNREVMAGGHTDPRTTALVACLAVAGLLPRLVPEVHPMLSSKDIRARGREYVAANWAAKAARDAYRADAAS